ncbi:hypothetical protein [Sorangium cellulosum]|uniref:hypothetical protein n=1 Tax=Sorangium cellulosum TaxID=56 RepID=UPI00138AE13B|nr:hypothetical protein [Sorangium cellulosum]
MESSWPVHRTATLHALVDRYRFTSPAACSSAQGYDGDRQGEPEPGCERIRRLDAGDEQLLWSQRFVRRANHLCVGTIFRIVPSSL